MWGWIAKARQFINRLTNQVLGRRNVNQIVNANITAHQADILALNDRLFTDAMSLTEWEADLRSQIKNSVIQQYLLGKGGQTQMTSTDYGSIGGMLAEQYGWLSKFSRQIANGELSPARINQRAVMYIASSREAFERAKARSYGIPLDKLPGFPGQGTLCEGLTNCKCSWRFVEKKTLWECYWELGQVKEKHCTLCPEHAKDWNPYVVDKPTTKSAHNIITNPPNYLLHQGSKDVPERVSVVPLTNLKISWPPHRR